MSTFDLLMVAMVYEMLISIMFVAVADIAFLIIVVGPVRKCDPRQTDPGMMTATTAPEDVPVRVDVYSGSELVVVDIEDQLTTFRPTVVRHPTEVVMAGTKSQ